MSRVARIVVSVLLFAGFIIYLAGVADSNSICNKVQNGDLDSSDLVSSGPDASKSFMPLDDPWGMPAKSGAASDAVARKLLGGANGALFPSHRRALMSTSSDHCGWTYSFAWWTVALQGLAVILVILTALDVAPALLHVVGPFLYVNTALLCVIASDLIPTAANLNATKTKGQYPDAVFTTSAGIVITLIANFLWFIVANVHVSSHGLHAEVK